MSKHEYQIMMLGDSLIEWGDWSLLLDRNDVLNAGRSGYTSAEVKDFLNQILQDNTVRYCFMMSGINDLFHGTSVDDVLYNQLDMLQMLRAHHIKPVVLLTLYVHNDAQINTQVQELNKKMFEHCTIHGIPTLNLNHFLSDDSGLKSEYTEDGVHLSSRAYSVWSRVMQEYLEQTL